MEEELEQLRPGAHPPCIYYQVIPVEENVSIRRARFILTATGIEGVPPSEVKLKDIKVTILFDIPSQPAVPQVATLTTNQPVILLDRKRETLRSISREIAQDVGNKWYQVGGELGISKADLEILRQKHPEDVTERFYYMLKKRIKQGNFDLRMLCDALKSDRVKQYETANKLQLLLTNNAILKPLFHI